MKDLKGKVLVGLASVSMLGGIALGSVQGFATQTSDETQVEVRFSGETNPPVTPNTLQLHAVPAFAAFGGPNDSANTNVIVAGNAVTSRVGTLTSNYVKINDARNNAVTQGTDWELTASASPLVEGADSISNGNITLASAGADTIKAWTPGSPTALPGTVSPGNYAGTATITKPTSIVLPLDDTSVTVAEAVNSVQGEGYAVPIDSASLNITSTSTSYANRTFEGTITWTLDDLA